MAHLMHHRNLVHSRVATYAKQMDAGNSVAVLVNGEKIDRQFCGTDNLLTVWGLRASGGLAATETGNASTRAKNEMAQILLKLFSQLNNTLYSSLKEMS